MSDPADVAAAFCATLVDEWGRAGVKEAVVCPGSRSTPMALALAADDHIRVHVLTDERSAAFVALGIGLASGIPAVLLTTSGTAAVEAHPAVVEAHHAKVPLIVCTADRPLELHGVGAPQAIDQQRLYGTSARWFVDAGVPESTGRDGWRSLAARVANEALGPPAGPVQCNLAFREPLVGTAQDLPEGRPGGAPWLARSQRNAAPLYDEDALAARLHGRRGVIVAGGGIDDAEPVLALAEALGWPVLADQRSGCRLPRAVTISHFDALLRVESFAARSRPEVVLRLGALPASKVLGSWLAGLDAWQLGVERDGSVFDPDGSLTTLIAADPSAFCDTMRMALQGDAPVAGRLDVWTHADAKAARSIRTVLGENPNVTEPAVARSALEALPEGACLVVSSSMPVRDLEWYGEVRAGVRVLSNRGANGIDGVLSTAHGVALATAAPTVALLGDLAFLYDTNAMSGTAADDTSLTAVVVDNRGGGIFEFLPQAEVLDRDRFEWLFATPHDVDLAMLATAHGARVSTIEQAGAVGEVVAQATASRGLDVIIVPTDRRHNVVVHRAVHDAVAAALES